MTGILVSGYDVDNEHIADVFESMAADIRRGNVHLTQVSDAVEVDAEDAIEYTFEMSFIIDESALTMDYLNGRLVETNVGD